jgi:anaerobic selenocysteine-containing dehydrogenase
MSAKKQIRRVWVSKMTNRKKFLKLSAAAVVAMMCPGVLCAGAKNARKTKAYSLINVDKKVCGTCQHWRGERVVVDRGLRVKCQHFAESPCFRGAGFKYPATSPAASHGCIRGGQYKRWIGLPK